jgi:hypothetical protein
VAGRSPKKAWAGTRSDWRPELLYALVGGILSIVILTIAGWPEGHASYFIPLASALGAALLVPFAQFVWRLTWQPWEQLRDDVTAIREGAAPKDEAAPVKKPLNKKLTALNYVRIWDDIWDNSTASWSSKENRQSEWTDQVVQFLATHVSAEEAERFLKTGSGQERRGLLAEIAEGLDT